MKNFKKYFTKSTIIFSIIFLAIGFTGGFFTSKISKKTSFPGGNMAASGQPPQMGGNNNSRGNKQSGTTQTSNLKQTMGEITKIDDSSITVKTPDGGSKIILLSDSTTVNKAAQGSKSDLKVGSNISITGDSNSDGSVTGKSININSDTTSATITPTAKK